MTTPYLHWRTWQRKDPGDKYTADSVERQFFMSPHGGGGFRGCQASRRSPCPPPLPVPSSLSLLWTVLPITCGLPVHTQILMCIEIHSVFCFFKYLRVPSGPSFRCQPRGAGQTSTSVFFL